MTRRAAEIVRAAMELPEDERVRVLEELLVSLEPAPDEDVDAEWAAEIERRSAELKGGMVRPIPWSEVRSRARKRARGKG
jgi:putative addiction module component (TIGR02574 family)